MDGKVECLGERELGVSKQGRLSNIQKQTKDGMLQHSTIVEVVLDDDVREWKEHELHVVGVGGAREVRIQTLRVLSVEALEPLLHEGAGILIGVVPWERFIG